MQRPIPIHPRTDKCGLRGESPTAIKIIGAAIITQAQNTTLPFWRQFIPQSYPGGLREGSGRHSRIICDAGRLQTDFLKIIGGRADAIWMWRIGDSELGLSELETHLEPRTAELRTRGILICGLGAALNKEGRDAMELVSRFCRRRNIDLFRTVPKHGEYSRDFEIPALCLIYSQPMKPLMGELKKEYSEYLVRAFKAEEDGGPSVEIEFYLSP
jgi:hypothetical protein